MRNNYLQPTWGKVHGLVDEDFLAYTLSLDVGEVRRLTGAGVLPSAQGNAPRMYRLAENVGRFIAQMTGESYRPPIVDLAELHRLGLENWILRKRIWKDELQRFWIVSSCWSAKMIWHGYFRRAWTPRNEWESWSVIRVRGAIMAVPARVARKIIRKDPKSILAIVKSELGRALSELAQTKVADIEAFRKADEEPEEVIAESQE
jgi:hypothetical protein